MTITYQIHGVRNNHGYVRGAAFVQDNGGFPEDAQKATAVSQTVARTGSVSLTFKLPSYTTHAAFAFYHDEKQIGRIEKGFFGIPKCGITLSNWNGRSRPKFSSAYTPLKKVMQAKLKYF